MLQKTPYEKDGKVAMFTGSAGDRGTRQTTQRGDGQATAEHGTPYKTIRMAS